MAHRALCAGAVVAALILIGACPPAAAILVFSGIDPNGSDAPLAATPNADAARDAFFANLIGVGTETFESRSGVAPLAIEFGSAGVATLTGAGGVSEVPPGESGAGRYSVPSGTSSKFWANFDIEEEGGGSFAIEFDRPIAAFGFYGLDIGDFEGTLSLELLDEFGNTTTLAVPTAPREQANGSVLYFGFIDTATQYTRVSFVATAGGTIRDIFGFDNFTIGSLEQVQIVPQPEQVQRVPQPATVALLGLGLAGLAIARRRW